MALSRKLTLGSGVRTPKRTVRGLLCATLPRAASTAPPAISSPRRVICSGFICAPSPADPNHRSSRSEEHTSELQSLRHLVCRLLLEKKKGNSDPTRQLCFLDTHTIRFHAHWRR